MCSSYRRWVKNQSAHHQRKTVLANVFREIGTCPIRSPRPEAVGLLHQCIFTSHSGEHYCHFLLRQWADQHRRMEIKLRRPEYACSSNSCLDNQFGRFVVVSIFLTQASNLRKVYLDRPGYPALRCTDIGRNGALGYGSLLYEKVWLRSQAFAEKCQRIQCCGEGHNKDCI